MGLEEYDFSMGGREGTGEVEYPSLYRISRTAIVRSHPP